ncbi:MAG: substrate-binding domain-containing protein [Nitrososphaerota archaeon]|nr:substrate-binding domain-containing protein [Nitrososphaerota archaeon]
MAISKLILVVILIVLVVLASVGVYFVSRPSGGGTLIIYSADAYVSEVSYLSQGFSNQSGIETSPPKGGGTFSLAQQIADGNPVSVFVSVSRSAVTSSYLKSEASGWAIAFASDQMALAYSNASASNPAAKEVIRAYEAATSSNNSKEWSGFYSSLTSGSVKVGISNPAADPAGLRGWLVLEAAGMVYAQNESYFASRMLQNLGNITGASAADLVAPLESGQIQFLFIYRSAAVSHGLEYLKLPSAVNFGDPKYTGFYSQFEYATSKGTESGSPILLLVTVPSDATNPSGSLAFVSYIVQHRSELESFGLTPLSPAVLYNDTSVPTQISKLVLQGDVSLGGKL